MRLLRHQSPQFSRLYCAQSTAVRPSSTVTKPDASKTSAASSSSIDSVASKPIPPATSVTDSTPLPSTTQSSEENKPINPATASTTTATVSTHTQVASIHPVTSAAAASSAAAAPDVVSSSSSPSEETETKKGEGEEQSFWRKHAWKFAGTFITIMVSYKTLKWYVERLAADAKRMREEMEENRLIAADIRKKAIQPQLLPFGTSSLSPDADASAATPSNFSPPPAATTLPISIVAPHDSQSSPVTVDSDPIEYFLKMAAQIVPTSSELDELYAYKRELEDKMNITNQDSSGVAGLKEELDAVVAEIKVLESKNK